MSPRLTSAITSSPASRASREHALERGVARGAVPLEERDLRLHDADPVGRGLDDAQAELAHALGGVGLAPLREQRRRAGRCRRRGGRRPRTRTPSRSPNGDHAVAVHALIAAARRAPYSCRLVTSKPPRTASSEATAADELGDRREQRDVGGDRRGADLVAVGARRAAARRVDDDVDLAAVDELDDGCRVGRRLVAELQHLARARCRCGASTSAVPSVAAMS